MPTTAWVEAGRGRSIARAGASANAWANPGNITADDASNATWASQITGAAQFSVWLAADQFDFSSIPSGATIDGIEVEFQLSVDTAANSTVHSVNIGKSDAVLGTQKSPATAVTTNPVNYDYGGAADKWGFGSISFAEVQTSTFQALVSVGLNAAFILRTFAVDAIWMRVTYTGGAVNADANITEANDTVSGSAALDLQGSLSQTEDNDTLLGSGGVEIQVSLAATEADDFPTTAGALEIIASAFLTEGDDVGVSATTLLISANVAITEADDVRSSSGTLGIVGFLNVVEGNDTLDGTAAVSSLANAAMTEGDDTLNGLAQMPIFYPRRGGVDERENYERRQREWQEDLRRIIDEAWLIAYGIIDPVTRQPLPPPDYSTIIEGLLDQALTLDRQRTDAFIAEQRRLAEDDAIAVLLLAA